MRNQKGRVADPPYLLTGRHRFLSHGSLLRTVRNPFPVIAVFAAGFVVDGRPASEVPAPPPAPAAVTPTATIPTVTAATSASPSPAPAPTPAVLLAPPVTRPGATLNAEDDTLLEDLERASFQYFVEQAHPVTGLVRDRARADGSPSEGKASISASGFALSSWAIATKRGWVERNVALERVRLSLRFLATKAKRQHGFFYHFMEMDTGERAWQCELSSIDTALFLAGAIIAREYFQDPEITALVNQLYRETDWQWFLNGGDTVALGWYDETGFSRFRWRGYSEHTMMSILGLGAPEHALDRDYWQAWRRRPARSYAGYYYIQGSPLFIHQYAAAYIDFRETRDAFADYYHNSVLATLAQRRWSLDLRSEFPSWSERLWGVTASDSSTGYKAWGGPPRTTGLNALDGTIVPCATAGSLPFAPFETLMVLRHIRTVYGDRTWKRYGFVDAFNPEDGWVDSDVIGIDLGISILQAENARSGMIWGLFMQAPEIQRALVKAGFVSKSRDFTWAEREKLRSLASQAWKSLIIETPTADTAGLRITGVLAAHALGFVDSGHASKLERDLLQAAPLPTSDTALAEYAASLITLRQAFPSLTSEANRQFELIKWETVTLSSAKLESASRLAAFFKIASGKTNVSVWKNLVRTPEKKGPVYVLSPANLPDQLRPGLWLDEDSIITGASAAQFAYASAVELPATATPPNPPPPLDVLTASLLASQLPKELMKHLAAQPPPADWVSSASVENRAILLITLANLLVPGRIQDWFQEDPYVRSARSSIPEFTESAFGSNTSVYWRAELSGPFVEPPERKAIAVSSAEPRENWNWVKVAGLEFKDSPGDVRPDDPPLELHFAFTWDAEALHFYAEAIDTPEGFKRPDERREVVELTIDPQLDGFVLNNPDDRQYLFPSSANSIDAIRNRPIPAKVTRTPQGYTVEATLPWSSLNLTPKPGLEFGVSAAVATGGRYEWEPSLKLNWRFVERRDEKYGLGVLHLQ
jgi:hypothetical protein